MARKRKSERQKSRKPQSSRARNRRLAQRSSQSKSHLFEALEDRRLLATLTVNSSLDLVDGDTSSVAALINSPGADGISLREAIVASNNTDGADTVTFDSNVFTGGADSLIRLTNGELEITDSLTIDASNAVDVTITGDANGDDVTDASFITNVGASFGGIAGAADDLLDDNSRVLNFSSTTPADLTLSGLTITGGRTTDESASGGGLLFSSADGRLSLTNSTISGNSTLEFGSRGGGIAAFFAEVTIDGSTVSDNSTEGTVAQGGGIFTVSGTLTVTDSDIIRNSTAGDYASGGGGILSFQAAVTLDNTTVSGNSTSGTRSNGGGVHVADGTLSLTNSSVSRNSTSGPGASGGGIFFTAFTVLGGPGAPRIPELTITDSAISENSTTGDGARGGGIYSSALLTLTGSTVSENSTSGDDAEGGGASARLLTLTNSIVSNNFTSGANARGGGVSAGAVVLTNSTVSGNFTSGNNVDGGGVVVSFLGTAALVTNSTISGNASTGSGGGILGGHVYSGLTITNSIVAGNLQNKTVNSNGTPNDIEFSDLYPGASPTLTLSSNLIGVADNIAGAIQGNGNQLGTEANPLDPMLGPLAFNGGPTRTHALLPGSPAIDAGSNALAVDEDGDPLLTDQRGDGFDRIVSGTVDIGAFEFDANALPVPPAIVSTVRDEGGVLERPDLLTTYSVTFDADVNVEASDLTIVNELLSTENVDPSAVAFTYDQATQTATWDFTALTLDAAFYSFELSDDIVSATGNVGLDGDGDGNAGGNFVESVYVALPGDANLDGQVDVLNDAFALVTNLGLTGGATWAQGDFNDDGVVDILGDAFILVGNLGRSVAPPVSTGSVATAVAARSAESASSTQQVVLIDDTQTTSLFEKADAKITSRLSIATGPNSLAGSIDAAFEDQGLLDGELIG